MVDAANIVEDDVVCRKLVKILGEVDVRDHVRAAAHAAEPQRVQDVARGRSRCAFAVEFDEARLVTCQVVVACVTSQDHRKEEDALYIVLGPEIDGQALFFALFTT